MGYRILLLVGVFVFLGYGQVFGQVEGDTAVARRLLSEATTLLNIGKYDESFAKADSARINYSVFFGEGAKEVADALFKMGAVRYFQRDYDSAIIIWEKSKEIRVKTLGKDHLEVAKLHNNIGLSYQSKGEYNKAIDCFQIALEIRLKARGEDHPDVAASHYNLGACYHSTGDYDRAIQQCQKALDSQLKSLGPLHPKVADLYDIIGASYGLKGWYDKAINFQQKVLDIRLKAFGEEHPDVAGSYNNIGNTYQSKGEYNNAIDYHQKSLKIKLKILGAEHPDVAHSYINLGNSYESKGEYDKAIKHIQRSLDIRLKTLGIGHPEVSDSYNSLGISYDSKGAYDKAIDHYQKALEIRLKTLGEEYPSVATLFNNIGASYTLKGEYDKATDNLKKALDIRLRTLGTDHRNVGDTYSNIGANLNLKGEYEKAIEYSQKALEIRLKTLGAEHQDVADSYYNVGNYFKSKRDYEKALEYFKKASEILLNGLGHEHPDLARVYNNLGNTYMLKNEPEIAIQYYQKSIFACSYTHGNFSNVNSSEQLLEGLNGIGLTFKAQYNLTKVLPFLNQSFDYTYQALFALDFQQSTFPNESTKSHWLSQNYPIYEQAISISLLKADVDHNDTLRQSTFKYAEKSKASLLQAQIKAADAINFSGIPDSLLQKEHDLRIDITWREKQRQSLLDKGLSETDTNTLRISSIIFDLKRDYETLKNRFETEYPEYYRLKYDLSTVSLQYVQDSLLESQNQALLEYFVGDSSIFLFVVRPDTMIVHEVKRDFPLEDWIQGLRYGLYGYYTAEKLIQTDSLKADARSKYLEFALKLYEKLVAPVAQYLPEKVILVPDGPLGYVPFDALLTGAPEDLNNFKSYPYLLQKHQFSYTYSATLLREMRDKKHRQEPEKDFIAFAPFYNGDTTLLASMYAYDELMRKDLQPLAYTGPEVAAASKLMRGETIAGAAATEERFTSMASNYRIIHLATHGRADNRVGDYAFLAFTEIKDSIENELLYVKDLYNLSLNADLVVLSACETGIGKLQRGEGIISLARAFAYAGAKSIVTSLWSVNDKSTSELMRFFYRELKRGKDKDEALRLARLRFLKESSVRNSHPFFWAAFVPIGDMRPVK